MPASQKARRIRGRDLSVHDRLGRSYRTLLSLRRFFVQALAVHPTLGLDLEEPILRCRNASEIFPDMLLSHIADGNLLAIAIRDGNTKQFLRQENTLGM